MTTLDNTIIVPAFDRDYWIAQLKKEVGLPHIPYNKLAEYTVDFESPFGLGKTTKNAKEYVDEQLALIEGQYSDASSTLQAESKEAESWLGSTNGLLSGIANEDIPQLQPIVQEVNKLNIRYLDVRIVDMNYTVIINDDGTRDKLDQINSVIYSPWFIKERKHTELTQLENFISWYQYSNAVQLVPKPKKDVRDFEDITKSMDTIFDGIKLEGF